MCIFFSLQSPKKKEETVISKDIQIDRGIVHNHKHTIKVTPEKQTLYIKLLQRRRKTTLILQRKRGWLICNTEARLMNISGALRATVKTLFMRNHISAQNI